MLGDLSGSGGGGWGWVDNWLDSGSRLKLEEIGFAVGLGLRETHKFLNIGEDGIIWDVEGCRRGRFGGGEMRSSPLAMSSVS